MIAKKHNIPGYEFKECGYTGECNGTCPACDKELQDLTNKVNSTDGDKSLIDISLSNEINSRPVMGKYIVPSNKPVKKSKSKYNLTGSIPNESFMLEGEIMNPELPEGDTEETPDINNDDLYKIRPVLMEGIIIPKEFRDNDK